MKKLLVPILLLILSVLAAETFPLPVGEFAPRSYTAFRTVEGIKVDGSLDDIDWEASTITLRRTKGRREDVMPSTLAPGWRSPTSGQASPSATR